MTTSTPTAVATVSLSGVTKRYRSLAALDDVDLELGPGITGLLGPNGAGKTTMLRVMATVLRPDGGTVRLLGRDPMDPDARTDVRRRLGYQPQELGFPRGFHRLRVRQLHGGAQGVGRPQFSCRRGAPRPRPRRAR